MKDTLREHLQKIAAKGGNATFKKYGTEHMKMMARKSSIIMRKKGSQYFKDIRQGKKPNAK